MTSTHTAHAEIEYQNYSKRPIAHLVQNWSFAKRPCSCKRHNGHV